MVLSNKKLKQQIKAKFAEISNSKNPDFEIVKNPDFEIVKNPETPKSLKQLLDSTTQKPRLSKREKRRENLSTGENNDIHVEKSSKGKKRKREKVGVEDEGGVELKVDENGGGVELRVDENGGGKLEVVANGGEGEKLSIKRLKRIEMNKRKEKEKNELIEKLRGENGGGFGLKIVDNGDGKLEVVENGGEGRTLGVKKLKKMLNWEKEKNELGEKSEGDVVLGVKEGSDLSKEKRIETEEKQSEVDNAVFPEQIVDETREGNEDDCKKVYVGGMPYSSTEDDMWSFFDHCGTITDIDCMKFPETGKFRGIAFISFKTEEAAKKALALDGSEMDGFYLKIQPYKATRTTKSSAFIPPVIEGYNRIYAGNLSWDITEEDLQKFFSDCNITSIRFGEDKETGEFKGYAHVDFSDSDSLTKALKLDQQVVSGRTVKISRAVPVRAGIRNPGSVSAPSTVKPQQNNIGVMPPAVKPEENYSVIMPAAVQPEESYDEVFPPVVQPPENNTGVSSGKLKRRTCYECGERGHISSACPKKQAAEQTAPNAG
uniref:Uncharacterized protein n=1 Tax=Chenopodium quinoa TaxID=63459 RepID=A0A803M2R5_CHEQI